jgi:hypothetical protein
MFEMDLHKFEKFNFFKKQTEDKQNIKTNFVFLGKRLLKLSGFFVIVPALLYLLLKSVPELKHSLPTLLESVSSQSLTGIALTVYGIYMAAIILKGTFNTASDGQELGKEFSNIFLPILFAIETGLVLGGLSSIWAVIWPLIR